MKSISIKGPQVGDLVKVRDEYLETLGEHMGIVEQVFAWPEIDLIGGVRPVVSCVIFREFSHRYPTQFQTRFIEIVSAVSRG